MLLAVRVRPSPSKSAVFVLVVFVLVFVAVSRTRHGRRDIVAADCRNMARFILRIASAFCVVGRATPPTPLSQYTHHTDLTVHPIEAPGCYVACPAH